MDAEIIADLKQFITGTMAQHAVTLRQELGQEIRRELQQGLSGLAHAISVVDRKVDDLTSAVADSFTTYDEENQRLFKNHDKRISRLEDVYKN